jgi:hypothetical protein
MAAPVAYTVTDLDTTVRTAWAESRGEPEECQIGVIWVIRRRVEFSAYPQLWGKPWWGSTPDEVCRKPWQFSCRNATDPNLPKLLALRPGDPEYLHFKELVVKVFEGTIPDPTLGSTTYKRTGTAASWDKAVDSVTPIVLGHQSFWRLSPNGKVLPFLKPPAPASAVSERAVPAPATPQPREVPMLSKMFPFLLARLQEPSTYAGLGALALALGMHLTGDQVGALTSVLVAGAGAAATFLPESKKS